MKKFLLFFFLMIMVFGHSQNHDSELFGKWRIKRVDFRNNLIHLTKEDSIKLGTTLVLNPDYSLREIYLASCGIDPQMQRSYKKGIGKWSHQRDKSIHTSFSILTYGRRFAIKSLDQKKMVLVPLDIKEQ